jgi:hypothetical protein
MVRGLWVRQLVSSFKVPMSNMWVRSGCRTFRAFLLLKLRFWVREECKASIHSSEVMLSCGYALPTIVLTIFLSLGVAESMSSSKIDFSGQIELRKVDKTIKLNIFIGYEVIFGSPFIDTCLLNPELLTNFAFLSLIVIR